jgi:hypothetical protein
MKHIIPNWVSLLTATILKSGRKTLRHLFSLL